MTEEVIETTQVFPPVHRAMFVHHEYAAFAAAICEAFEPISGSNMFQTPVYDSNGVLIYRCSNGYISSKFAEAVDDKTGEALYEMCIAFDPKTSVTRQQCEILMSNTISSPDRQAYDMAMENGWTFHDPKAEETI